MSLIFGSASNLPKFVHPDDMFMSCPGEDSRPGCVGSGENDPWPLIWWIRYMWTCLKSKVFDSCNILLSIYRFKWMSSGVGRKLPDTSEISTVFYFFVPVERHNSCCFFLETWTYKSFLVFCWSPVDRWGSWIVLRLVTAGCQVLWIETAPGLINELLFNEMLVANYMFLIQVLYTVYMQ